MVLREYLVPAVGLEFYGPESYEVARTWEFERPSCIFPANYAIIVVEIV